MGALSGEYRIRTGDLLPASFQNELSTKYIFMFNILIINYMRLFHDF